MTKIVSIQEFSSLEDRELGVSPWMEITQERVDQFADATNDHQFIHVDPERAAKTPLGGTIAHGFLTLSLVSHLLADTAIYPEGLVMGLNYGSDRVRFLQPVLVGQRIRAHQKVLNVTQKSSNNWLIKTQVTVEIENNKTPAMVAEILALYITQ